MSLFHSISKPFTFSFAISRQFVLRALPLICVGSPLLGWGQTTNLVTVTAQYSQLPAATDVVFEEMKFGKTAGFIFTKDDGAETDATVVMPVLNGGRAANGLTYPGAYYTDGTGLPVKFKYTFAVNTSAMRASWQAAYAAALAKGDNLANHSHLHTKAYNAWRAIKDTEIAVYDKLGVRMRTLVIPTDHAGYVVNSTYLGYKFIGSSFAATTTDGFDAEIRWNDKLNVATLNATRILSSRANFDGKWMESGQPTIKAFVDNILAQSTNGVKLVGHAFAHGPDENEVTGFKAFVDYLMNHPDNNDRVWIAGQQELMEYYEVRNYFLSNPGRVAKAISGNSIVYTFDVAGLPAEGLLRDFSLRLPGANLTGVIVSGADTASYNLASGLVNVYLKNKAVKSPHADTVPPQILAALVSPADSKAIDLTYSKNVTQTVAGFSVAGNTITSLTGSGKQWTLHLLNDWLPTQAVTYQLQTGDAVETGNASNKVCSHLEFIVSREEVDAIAADQSQPLHFRNYLWQDIDGAYASFGPRDYQQFIATQTVAPGQEARIFWKNTNADGAALAFATTNKYNEAVGIAEIEAGVMLAGGNIRLVNNGVDSYAGSAIAAYYGLLRRANGTIILQSSNDGTTWMNGPTLSLVSNVGLYVVAALRSTSAPLSLIHPRIELLGKITSSPLPVALSEFTATREAEGVKLRWQTATEKDNARFEVQRADDNLAFRTITTVKGLGQSASRQTYTLLDPEPHSGLGYYRLRQVDYDGTATWSPVVTVAAHQEVLLYPNPARTELNLRVPGAGTVRYRVLNMLGAVMLEGAAPAGTATLNVAALPASLYQLETVSAAGRVVRKFVKEN